MKCRNCGTEISDSASFCPECGAAVASAPVNETPVNEPVNPAPQDSSAQQTYNQQSYDQTYSGETQQTYNQQAYNQQTYNQQPNSQSYNYTPQQGYVQNMQPQKPATPTLSIIGLVLGILSILCCCSGSFGLLFGIPGVILSVMGNKNTKTGIGTAGMICSIIGIVLAVLVLIYTFVMMGMSGVSLQDMYQEMYYDYYY